MDATKLPPMLQWLSYVFGVPRFRFNQKLFGDLIREGPKGNKIEAPSEEPRVVFEMGPPSNVLGSYNPRTKRITIDVLANYLACFGKSDEDLCQRFDERMTSTLAHEGGHWQLDKRHGMAPFFEKMAIHVAFMAVGALIVLSCLHFLNRFCVYLFMVMWGHSYRVLPIVGLIVFAAAFWVFVKMFFEVWHTMAFGVTYRLCYDERYARAFERRAEADPRWRDVIRTR